MTESAPAAPRRFEIGERYRPAQMATSGTVIVRDAWAYGYGDLFAAETPCCRTAVRVSATDATWRGQLSQAPGAARTCRGCGWKWYVHLAVDGRRLAPVPEGTRNLDIDANQAEFTSRGRRTRPYRRRRPG